MARRPRLFTDTLAYARGMRHGSTDAEARMWRFLRGRRLAGAKFRRQVPIGPYIVDFYCDDAKLVVELDGGGHGLPRQGSRDANRKQELERLGITVMTFWNTDVMQNLDGVLERIASALVPPSP